MTRYIMGNGKILAIYSLIALAVVLIPFTIITIVAGIYNSFHPAILAILLLAIPFLGTLYYGIKLEKRKRIALAGVKTTGIVESVYPQLNHGNGYWVEYSYEILSQEKRLGAIKVTFYDVDLFEKGMEIPVYVGGEYGYFDIEEIRDKRLKEMAQKEENKKEE